MRRFLLVSLLLVPATARAAERPAHRVNGDLAIHARDIIQRRCAGCHTGADAPGQSKLKLMDHAKVSGKKSPLPLLDPKGRSLLLDLVKDGSMPPANHPGPTEKEIEKLEEWVKAGAPAYPEAFDERYVLNLIADDLDARRAKGGRPDVQFENVRYISFAHLVQDGRPPDLAVAETRLVDALAVVTGAPTVPVPLEAVDPAATVFRLDLFRLGWRTRELFDTWAKGKAEGAARLRPFDLLQMESPDTFRLPPEDPLARRLLNGRGVPAPESMPPVPLVRGDWLATALADGKTLTPLGADVAALVALDKAVERKEEKLPNGPEAKPFAGPKALVVPAPGKDRAPVPSLSAWYAGDVSPDPPPFALKAELVDADGKPVAGVKVGEKFKLRVSAEKRVNFTLLMVRADGKVVVQEVGGVSVIPAKGVEFLAPNDEGFEISSIPTNKDTVTEFFVLLASEAELPVPTILRSRHDEKPIWRFQLLSTAEKKFDPNAVVRKVIPIPITKK